MSENRQEPMYVSAVPVILALVIVGFGLIGYVYWKGFHD